MSIKKLLFAKGSLGRKVFLLYLAQASAYVFPILTLPYLSRVLGPDTYALVGVTQSAALTLSIVGEYGFRYTSTREVALSRSRKEELRGIVSATVIIQLFMMLPLAVLAIILHLFVPLFRLHLEMTIFAFLIAMAQSLLPIWYFQGTEQLERISVLEILSRILTLLGIFLLVNGPADWHMALLAQFLGTSFSTIMAIWWMYGEVGFVLVSWHTLRDKLKSGFPIFLSRASNTLYTSANGFMLSLVSTTYQTGLFVASDRIARPVLSILWPLTNVFYTKSVQNLQNHTPSLRTNYALRKTLAVIIITGLLGGFGLYSLAPWLVPLILGEEFSEAVAVLRILALLLPVVAFGSALSTQVMLPLRLDREFMHSVILAGISNLLLAVLLAPKFGAEGMAVAVVVAESMAAVYRFVVLVRRGYLL